MQREPEVPEGGRWMQMAREGWESTGIRWEKEAGRFYEYYVKESGDAVQEEPEEDSTEAENPENGR